jgi:hypothetical protein
VVNGTAPGSPIPDTAAHPPCVPATLSRPLPPSSSILFSGSGATNSFNKLLRRSDHEPQEGLDTTAVTRNMILALTILQYCFFSGDRLFIDLQT